MQYKLPAQGSEIEIAVRVNWNEPDKMIKLSVPTNICEGKYMGQVAYGVDKLADTGVEVVSQKWSGLFDNERNQALTIVNDGIYGSDCMDGELRLSLLRSPAYSAHPIKDRIVMPQDRFTPPYRPGRKAVYILGAGGQCG